MYPWRHREERSEEATQKRLRALLLPLREKVPREAGRMRGSRDFKLSRPLTRLAPQATLSRKGRGFAHFASPAMTALDGDVNDRALLLDDAERT